MPFASQAQRRFMYAKHPRIAKRWSAEYPNQGKLPEKVDGAASEATEKKGEGIPMTFEEKVIDTFQVAAAALEKAEQADLEKAAMEKEAFDLIPEAVEACIRNGRVDAEDREKLAEACKDPRKVLKILAKVAAHRNVEEANHLGGQVDKNGNRSGGQTKKASYGSVDSPYCGVRSADKKPSDLAFERAVLG